VAGKFINPWIISSILAWWIISHLLFLASYRLVMSCSRENIAGEKTASRKIFSLSLTLSLQKLDKAVSWAIQCSRVSIESGKLWNLFPDRRKQNNHLPDTSP